MKKMIKIKAEEGRPIVWGSFKIHGYWMYGYKTAGFLDILKYKINQKIKKLTKGKNE